MVFLPEPKPPYIPHSASTNSPVVDDFKVGDGTEVKAVSPPPVPGEKKTHLLGNETRKESITPVNLGQTKSVGSNSNSKKNKQMSSNKRGNHRPHGQGR